MTENSTESTVTETDVNGVEETTAKGSGIRDLKHFEKGTWQATMVAAGRLLDRITGDRKKSSAYLWQAASSAIADWAENKADVDVHAENLYADVLDIMGEHRKGDVSKIKTVALAVSNKGLVLSQWPNLSKAYGEARRLTQTAVEEEKQDSAAEEVIEAIEAPKTASTPESAALILLSKGLDGAVVAILDALNGPSGEFNEAASRALMRAVSTEVAARVQAAKPKPEPKAAAPAKDKPVAAKKAPAPVKAKPATKAKPVSKSKGDPNEKALPPKQAQPESDDMFEEYDGPEGVTTDESVETETVTAQPKAKPAPVKRAAPVKRS